MHTTELANEEDGKAALRAALRVLLAAAIRIKQSDKAKKVVDEDRAGIAMWRIP